MTGRDVHALVADRHSLGSVQHALKELDRLGVITTEVVGRAGVHRINEDHYAIGPLRSLMNPLAILIEVVQDHAHGAQAVILFGSVARGEATVGSDVDLAVFAPSHWAHRIELEDAVHARLGHPCDVVHFTMKDVSGRRREPVLDEILRDGIALIGEKPRPNTRRAS